jgi:hypothetical protein
MRIAVGAGPFYLVKSGLPVTRIPAVMRAFICTAVFCAAALVIPGESNAQSYANTVWTQLQSAYDLAVRDGDYYLQNYIIGHSQESGSDSWTFPLSGGTEYMIIAACDEDCSDVDIAVYDSDGDTVASDVSADDVPVVRVTPNRDGQYSIEIKMYECSNEPCYWGFGVFYQ